LIETDLGRVLVARSESTTAAPPRVETPGIRQSTPVYRFAIAGSLFAVGA